MAIGKKVGVRFIDRLSPSLRTRQSVGRHTQPGRRVRAGGLCEAAAAVFNRPRRSWCIRSCRRTAHRRFSIPVSPTVPDVPERCPSDSTLDCRVASTEPQPSVDAALRTGYGLSHLFPERMAKTLANILHRTWTGYT